MNVNILSYKFFFFLKGDSQQMSACLNKRLLELQILKKKFLDYT